MVNAQLIKRKMPSLLLDTQTINAKNAFMRKRTHYLAFQRKRPRRHDELITKIVLALKELDNEVEACKN